MSSHSLNKKLDALSISPSGHKPPKSGGFFSSFLENNGNKQDDDDVQSSSFATRKEKTRFQNMFHRQKWGSIRKKLQSRIGLQLVSTTGKLEMPTVALALGHGAPLDIIKLILDLDETQGLQKDGLGASPLHTACLNGAALESIQLLLQKYPHLPFETDHDKRTPLHHAVEHVCSLDSFSMSLHESYVDVFSVVKLLVKVAPDTLHWPDMYNETPTELTYIVMIDTDSSSYDDEVCTFDRVEELNQILIELGKKVYLERRKIWEIGLDTSTKVKASDTTDVITIPSTCASSKDIS
jgi:hypothetical protein